MRWLAWTLVAVETILSWKFKDDAGNTFENATPMYIIVPWIVTIASAALFYIYLRFLIKNPTTIDGKGTKIKAN